MYSYDVTYNDYDGNRRTETLYFNLSQAEVIMLNLKTPGGIVQHLTNIINSNDTPTIVDEFTRFIKLAYGKKSEDGRRFIKSDDVYEEFEQTPAFSQLLIDLMSDGEFAAAFVNGIIPDASTFQNSKTRNLDSNADVAQRMVQKLSVVNNSTK